MSVLLKYKRYVVGVVCMSFFIACFVSCQQYQKNSTHKNVSDESIDMGKKLAATYCQSCHLLPDPSLLDAKSWEKGVLPMMGPRLGIFNNGFEQYPSYRRDKDVDKDFYPSQPILNVVQWQAILDYYTALAPDTLVANKDDVSISSDLSQFKPIVPAFNDPVPRISYINVDTVMAPHNVIICEVNRKGIFRFNNDLQLHDSLYPVGSIVDMSMKKASAVACNIGIMVPNNGKHGTINNLAISRNNKMSYDTIPMFDSLRRPVQIIVSDINKDDKEDYLVCEYGNLKGALSWNENLGNNKFERHVIREVPGAIKAYVQDYNNDGLPDIYVLFAQGDESIFLYTNKGNGKFEEKQLLRFPPVYGSTYFELADFNKDGFPDIVYTCGDNADFSAILKPYHGIYIYLNDGKNNFTQKYFFHINGCFKAMARDFDNDGDLDIAAISFFADYQHRPEEGFVYLENNGNFNFKAYNLPETQKGRWLTMDAGDLDGDGKTDIVLGNFSAPAMIKSLVPFEKGPPFLFLKNIGR
ncbi:VCBS repeat-containing protein [Panacibacter ginsenosidivorans]|uniref:VCBS repeat-containing protein n=1 Tax=Panacibacter ginsenosidivorans TaxID=1813871 RepID=A0A5B8VBT8_9BACT|nr:VCBS repeat-containing protein [Panacibacter ginsenosidivorans]QEC68473.1 VCBS repeat-containing protein [Panacibacter ginsenosidivorans]